MKKLQQFRHYESLILEWAKQRDLLHKENAPKQRLKLFEELGETAKAILHNDKEGIKDGIGDICVVLIILSAMCGDVIDKASTGKLRYKKFSSDYLLYQIISKEWYSIDLLSELSDRHNMTLIDCLHHAWEQIKDRTGKTVNGTFVKDC